MKCNDIRLELVGYHFGEIDPDVRREIEDHLPQCTDCVREFVRLKREIETADVAEAPSAAARGRLRNAVALEVGAKEALRPWSWWERPVAFVCAGVTVLGAIVFTMTLATSSGEMPHSLGELGESPPGLSAPGQ